MFLYLCEVYVCVYIPGLGPVGELCMRAYNVVLFLALAGLNQGQKGSPISSSRSLISSFKGSPRQCPWPCSG